MSNLKSYVIHTIGGGWGKETIEENLIKVSVIRGTDFPKLEKLDFSSVPIRFETLKKIESRTLQVGDLIIEVSGGSASSGQRTGRCLYITQEILDNLGKYVIPASFCRLLRLDKEKINSKFIYYQIAEMHLSDQIGIYENQSTGISNFQFNLFLDEIFPKITDLNKQNSIVDIFNSIDQKIQLNTQINQTLEQIAQALFKSWFVDFDPVRAKVQALSDGMSLEQAELAAMQAISGKTAEELTALSQTQPDRYAELAETAKAFPYEMVEVDGVEVPKGWECFSLKELSSAISKGTTPKKSSLNSCNSKGTVPFIKVKDISESGQILINQVEQIPEKISSTELKRSILHKNDILISIAGTIGRVAIVPNELENANTNQAISFIRLYNDNLVGIISTFLKSRKNQEDITSKVIQGVQANISLEVVRNIKIFLPINFDNKAILIFNSLLNKQLISQKENLLIEKSRDLLLTNLLNGEFIR